MNRHLFEVGAGGVSGFSAIHLERLTQRLTEIGHQFISSCPLRIDARHFFDPTNPPRAVSANYSMIGGS